MFGLMRRPQTAPAERALTPVSEFPFFLSRMREEFDRMLESWAGEAGWRWEVEMKDEPDALIVRAEAPGFEAGEFDIQVQDGYLVMQATHKEEKEEKPEKGKEAGESKERRERRCYEALSLPPGIARDKVEARYDKGILTITLPKTPEGKGRKVPVQTG